MEDYINSRASRRRKEQGNKDVEKSIKTGEFVITAYCCENYPHICNDGEAIYTASGTVATAGRTVAIDPKLIPYGTMLEIEGIGVRVAEDCGGAIKGNRIDLLFETHEEALQFGRQTRQVTIMG